MYPHIIPPLPYAPSAPPLEPEGDAREQERSYKTFSITCIALGALAIIAGASIGSPFIFGAGAILGIVGLVSLAPYSSVHVDLSYPRSVILPCPSPSPVTFYVTPPSHRNRPMFVSPPPSSRPQPIPTYPTSHIPVGDGGTIFTQPGDRIQTGRRYTQIS